MKFIIVFCLAFFVAIAFDVTPYLRGPVEWRWPYQFINTIYKAWLPITISLVILGLFKLIDSKKIKNIKIIFLILFIVSSLWQIAVIFFSRAGIGVLFHRITNPGLNGYFTAGINILDPLKFITNFPNLVLDLPMHAKGHPPGVPLAYYFLNNFTGDPFITVLLSIGLIIFLSGITIVPLYYATKSWRGVFLFLTIPALTLFLPLPDVLFPFFGILGYCFIKYEKYFLAGLVMAIGLFFSYSILPVLAFLVLLKPKKTFFIPIIIYFILFWETFLTVISGQAPRDYWTWIFFNLWDFAVFAGWPMILIVIPDLIRDLYRFRVKPGMTLIFIILLLTLSGFSRGEAGRIWLPLMALLPIGIDTKKLSTNFVMILLGLQMIQTLVLQEFWVPLW